MTRITVLTLACIVVLGGMLRLLSLSNNPPGFFADEAVIGVDAYWLAHHGTDHMDKRPHFLFQALGDYRGFVHIVSAIPFVQLFGLNEFSVRFTSALYGILTIILVYAVTSLLFEQHTALLAAFLLAISPWHIHLSRMGFEFASFPFWFLFAVYLFIQRTWYPSIFLSLSALTFGVSLYTYQPARLFTPLFIVLLIFIYWKKLIQKEKLAFATAGFVFFCTALPILLHLFSGESLARFQETSILFQSASWSHKITNIFHTYINYFSYIFLFSKGDSGFPGQFITRHSLPGLGLLYIMQLPFLIGGIILNIKQWKLPRSQILLGWLILYPIAGALVGNIIPFATRGIIGVIPMIILSSTGVDAYIRLLAQKRLWLATTASIILILCATFSTNHYLQAWKNYQLTGSNYWGWQYGAQPIMAYFLQHKAQYDEMYLSPDGFNGPDIFIPFYDPDNRCEGKCRVGRLDRYDGQKKQLFALDAEHMTFTDPTIHVVQTLYYPNGLPAFFISEPSH